MNDRDLTTTDQPRARDAAATRQDLLRAAQRRFVLLGYERSTTRDIADDAGVNVSLINRYFGGKHGLYQAAIAASSHELSTDESPGDVVAAFTASLDDGAWPQFGGHPLLMLLRDDGADEDIRGLRAAALGSIAERISAHLGSGSQSDLRAQLVLALFCGTVALRSSKAIEPLASIQPELLRRALEDVVAAIASS